MISISAKNDYSQVVMQYDSLSRLLEEQQISGQSVKSVVSTFDKVGNRLNVKYPSGKTINFVPDELDRIKQITSGQEQIASYSYTGPFRVKGRDYSNNTKLTVTYDSNRRVTEYNHTGLQAWLPKEKKDKGKGKGKGQEKEYAGIELRGITVGFSYGYDKEDNKLYEKRLHEGGKGDAFVYDSIYRLTGVKYGVSNLDPLTTYDEYLAFDSKQEFTLDGVGNRVTVSDGDTVNYTTNNLNQYTQIDNQSLTYDRNGNLTVRRIPLQKYLKERFGFHNFPKGKDWENNKCDREEDEDNDDDESSESDGFKNDLDGCKIDERKAPQVEMEWNYQYDYANRLMKVSRTFLVKGKVIFTREVASYIYDALGRRISKTTSNFSLLTSHFYYDGARVIEEYRLDKRNREELSAQYVYGNGIDEVLTMTRYKSGCDRDKGNAYYYHENAIGSIYAITNDKGKVVERYEYTVYGEVTITGPAGRGKRNHSTIGNRFMFTGREYDSETGLHYYRARYYSAELGRFLQRDPINAINLYAYANNNPVRFIDPFGEQAGTGDIAPRPGEIAQAGGNIELANALAAQRWNRDQARVEEQYRILNEKLEQQSKIREQRIIRVWNELKNIINKHQDTILREANYILAKYGRGKIAVLPPLQDVAEGGLLAEIYARLPFGFAMHPYQNILQALPIDIYALFGGTVLSGEGKITFLAPSKVDNMSDNQLLQGLSFEYSHLVLGHEYHFLFGSLEWLGGTDQEEALMLSSVIKLLP